MKTAVTIFVILTLLLLSTAIAQEFPIADGRDSTFLSGGAFDGTNYLLAIQGDTVSSTSITVQFLSTSGTLIGQRVSLGASGGWPMAAFDGTNYLVIWNDTGNTLYGRFISKSGQLVGSTLTIASNSTIGTKGGAIAFGDSTYLVVSRSNGYHYGQRISKSGALLGAPIQISDSVAADNALCFDGTKYLLAWRGKDIGQFIHGQFISAAGARIGSNFIIDDGPYASDNPVSIAFDGSRFLVCFHEQAETGNRWNLYGRFVTASGTVQDRIMIRDSSYDPIFPWVAFDGTNYLISWTENLRNNDSVGKARARFFNTSGSPIGSEFVLFDQIGNKVPMMAPVMFNGGKYLSVTTRVYLDTAGSNFSFTDGDIYGRFIQPLATGVHENTVSRPEGFSLTRNFPNPFNPTTEIGYRLPDESRVRLTISNVLGQDVRTLANTIEQPGDKSIQFDATGLPGGIYFYRLDATSISDPTKHFSQTRKMLLVK